LYWNFDLINLEVVIMSKIVTDETKLVLFQQFCALSISGLQNQMQRTRRPVPNWVILRTFNDIVEYGNSLEMANVEGMQTMLQNIVKAAAPALAPGTTPAPAE
jgi:hypothetical protein